MFDAVADRFGEVDTRVDALDLLFHIVSPFVERRVVVQQKGRAIFACERVHDGILQPAAAADHDRHLYLGEKAPHGAADQLRQRSLQERALQLLWIVVRYQRVESRHRIEKLMKQIDAEIDGFWDQTRGQLRIAAVAQLAQAVKQRAALASDALTTVDLSCKFRIVLRLPGEIFFQLLLFVGVAQDHFTSGRHLSITMPVSLSPSSSTSNLPT